MRGIRSIWGVQSKEVGEATRNVGSDAFIFVQEQGGVYKLLAHRGERLDVDAFLINVGKFRVERLAEMQGERVIEGSSSEDMVTRTLSFLIKTSVACPLTSLSLKASFSTTGGRGWGGM